MVRPRAQSAIQAIGRIGRYAILHELAKGGMSRVYLAHKLGSDRLCVVKQLHGSLERHETAARRFQREAHIVAHIDHPNIARVVDAGVESNRFCIAMEYIPGQTVEAIGLALRTRGQDVPPAVILAMADAVLDGLGHAHALTDSEGRPLEIVHRDLSPRNIMVSFGGDVKIIDFGVAQGRIDNFKTAPGMMVGTLRYMSPEQAMAGPITGRSDLYTLSVVLYELLSGKDLVADVRTVEVLNRVIQETPPPLSEVNPALPSALSDVIARGLQKRTEDRWETAHAMRAALREAGASIGLAPQDAMGQLVRELFPEQEAQAREWIDAHRRLIDADEDTDAMEQITLSGIVPPEPSQVVEPMNLDDTDPDEITVAGDQPILPPPAILAITQDELPTVPPPSEVAFDAHPTIETEPDRASPVAPQPRAASRSDTVHERMRSLEGDIQRLRTAVIVLLVLLAGVISALAWVIARGG